MKKLFLRIVVATGGQAILYCFGLITFVVMLVPAIASVFVLTRPLQPAPGSLALA